MAGTQAQVKWAQRKATVYVTIEVMDPTNVSVDFQEKRCVVRCTLPSGENTETLVDLYAAIKPEECRWMQSRGIILHLTKLEAKRWPNICEGKPGKNVKVDWSKWIDTDDEEEAEGKGAGGDFDMSQFGGMGGLGGMGGMDFSQFGGMDGMPEPGSEDDGSLDENDAGEEEETTAGLKHEADHCCNSQECESKVAKTGENAENQPTATV